MLPNPWILLGLVISHIAFAVGGFSFGRSHEAGAQAKVQHEQAVAYAGEIVKAQAENDKLSAEIEKAREAQRPKDRIITKEVVRYETVVPADRRCDLDGAWRVLHDAAASGEPPPADPDAVSAGGADRVEDAAALETVADNYAECRRYADQVRGWQAYYREAVGGQK